jgi:acyl carrier protein
MGDIFFPDNEKRAQRVTELINDCATLTYQLEAGKARVDELLQRTPEAVKRAYGNLAHTPPVTVAIISGVSIDERAHDSLRQAIHELIPARVTMKKVVDINQKILDSLKLINKVIDANKELGITMTEDQLDKFLKQYIAEQQEAIDKITDEAIQKELAELDAFRHSWTNEDK